MAKTSHGSCRTGRGYQTATASPPVAGRAPPAPGASRPCCQPRASAALTPVNAASPLRRILQPGAADSLGPPIAWADSLGPIACDRRHVSRKQDGRTTSAGPAGLPYRTVQDIRLQRQSAYQVFPAYDPHKPPVAHDEHALDAV